MIQHYLYRDNTDSSGHRYPNTFYDHEPIICVNRYVFYLANNPSKGMFLFIKGDKVLEKVKIRNKIFTQFKNLNL
jgi:hypothetical protein